MQRSRPGWQIGLESNGLQINTGKTEVMICSSRGIKANIKDSQGTSLRKVKKSKIYVSPSVKKDDQRKQ